MGTIHRFAFNGQEFEIEEGSAVWERVTAEGHHPIDELAARAPGVEFHLEVGAVLEALAERELGDAFVPAEHLSKDGLLARARELGVDAKGNWGVAKLVKAIAAAEAAQPPADDDAAPAGDGDDTASAQAD